MKEKSENERPEDTEFKVDDRRHWMADEEDADATDEEVTPAQPTIIDEYRGRAETAERKLQEYIDAFKEFKDEQEDFRNRLNRDVERRVELKFGELVSEFLGSVDDLDLALAHAENVPEAQSLATGVKMARDRFLGILEQQGVCKTAPSDVEFDPNEFEAIRVDPVDSPERDGTVTETLQPGYKLGDRVIRAARVAVGRYTASDA